MKTRGIIIIAGIFAIIIAVIFLPNNSIVVRPGLEDNMQMISETSLDISSSRADEPNFIESDTVVVDNQDNLQMFTDTSLDISQINIDDLSFTENTTISDKQEDVSIDTEVVEESSPENIVLITNEDGPDYWIDENGLKHYVLSIEDSPNLGE